MGCGDGGSCPIGPAVWENGSGLGATSVSASTACYQRELFPVSPCVCPRPRTVVSLVSAREPVSLDYVHLRPVSAHEHLKLVSAHEHLTLVSAHGHLTLVSVHEHVDLSAHGHVLAHVLIQFQIYLSDYVIVWMLV